MTESEKVDNYDAAVWYLLEFFFEVVVHPSVQEGTANSRDHSDHVRNEENEKKVVPLHHRLVVVLRHQQQIQRQPADDEYRHHGDEHPIGALLATNFKLHTLPVNARTHTHIHSTSYILINNTINALSVRSRWPGTCFYKCATSPMRRP